MTIKRVSLSGAMVLIAGLGIVMALLTTEEQRFLRAAHRMTSTLRLLPGRRPPEIPPRAWENAVMAPSIACVNVFTQDQVRLDELERFNAELEQELEGEVDLETLDWILDRLGRTRVEPRSRGRLQDYLELMRRHHEIALQELRAASLSPGGAPAAAGGPTPLGTPAASSPARPGAANAE